MLTYMDLCNTQEGMTKAPAKKTGLTSFRLSPEFRQAAETLAEVHGVTNLSQYWRGLIYLDALLASGETDLLDKPAWVTRDYGELIRNARELFKSAPISQRAAKQDLQLRQAEADLAAEKTRPVDKKKIS
jgi:hypothetical protein